MSELISLCSFSVAGQQFGLETRAIREVLGAAHAYAVPLAPAYVAGVIAYRGDVVTAVSLRALLGEAGASTAGCVLVLDLDEEEEPFGLMVDSVGGVVTFERGSRSANPVTLGEVNRLLFRGAFRTHQGLLVELNPEALQPMRLAATRLFAGALQRRHTPVATAEGAQE